MKHEQQKIRLQKFWGMTVFSFGVLWGICNLVYLPIAVVTSITGSSWMEALVVVAGGLLTFAASVGAFYNRRVSSRILMAGGIGIFIAAVVGLLHFPDDTRGALNQWLMIQAGIAPVFLGVFGEIIERNKWPELRNY